MRTSDNVVMAKGTARRNLYDPRRGDQAIRVAEIALGREPIEPRRTNYFSVYWIPSGRGTFWADAARHPYAANSLLFFTPYQHIRLVPERKAQATLIQFHANFLCVETFHAEVGCSSVLFNDPYGVPAVALDDSLAAEVADLIERMRREDADQGLAYSEVLVAYTKVLLVLATRRKMPDSIACRAGALDHRHDVLVQLRDAIEENYRTLHSPADYAQLLHMTPKNLGRIVRQRLGKTLSDLIRERILIHAKWQLLHTLRPVKEIAREIGFQDELYFSRLFRKATGFSPKFFRQFETEIRGGSNLSMSLPPASIQPTHGAADNSDVLKN